MMRPYIRVDFELLSKIEIISQNHTYMLVFIVTT